MKLDKAITIVREYIESKIGGNVTVRKNQDTKIVTFAWVQNEKTVHEKHLDRAYSYEALESVISPVIIGSDFVDAYKQSKEPLEELAQAPVEKHKRQPSKKKAVEESVDLEVTKSVEEPNAEK